MLHNTVLADLFQQVPKNSPLLEWKSYDSSRKYLLLSSSERDDLPPSVFSNSVAPRWKHCLCELILRTVIPVENVPNSLKDTQALEKPLDDLVAAFIEFFNSILFRRITSHQAIGVLRDTLESCADTICSNQRISEASSPEKIQGDPNASKETRKTDMPLKNTAVKSSFTTLSQAENLSAVSVVLNSTQVHAAVLDALRWVIEYVTDLSEQMARCSVNTSHSSTTALSSLNVSNNTRGLNQFKAIETTGYQQRILLLLEVVEKTGLVSSVDIIANIPCSQLDYVGYCKTRDQLTLMKFFVRFRTKDVFTLPVYNLESENPLGYGRLHVCLQNFISETSESASCDCWRTTTMTRGAPQTGCPKVLAFVHHVQGVLVEFQLCINRVVTLCLLYLEHYLFVFRHSLLDALLCLVSRDKIITCFIFVLEYYEKNLTLGTLEPRQLTHDSCLIMKEKPCLPSHKFYHVCAYLHLEGLLELEKLWSLVGPSETFLKELVNALTQPNLAQGKPCDTTAEKTSSTSRYFDILPSTLSSEEASELLTRLPLGKHSLIAAFINLNAWSCALTLIHYLVKQCPLWSIHLSPMIMESLGSLLCWTIRPLIQMSSSDMAQDQNMLPSSNHILRSSAIGAYGNPYDYGSQAPQGIRGLQRVFSESMFRSTCVPLIRLLGLGLGQLPVAWFGCVVDAVAACLQQFCQERRESEPVPECYHILYSHILLPSLCLANPMVHVTESIWKGLRLFSVQERYKIYAIFYYHVKKHSTLIASSSQAVHRIIGRELKRVTAEQSENHGSPVLFSISGGGLSVMGNIVVNQKAKMTPTDKTVMDSLLKNCCANPFEVLDVILHHAELFDNMLIQVMLNYLPCLPDLCCDVTVFLVTERQRYSENTDQSNWSPSGPKLKKSRNLAHFIASFLRRFQAADVRPLLVSVASQIVQEITSTTYPHRLSRKHCDMIYLVELITYMGGFPLLSNEELSRDQVDSLGAGPGLRVMMLMDDARRAELYRAGAIEARSRLQMGLLNKHVFCSLVLGLSKLRLEVQYDCQFLCEATSLQLRSIAALTDEIQLALLQLIDFILLPEPSSISLNCDIKGLKLSYEKFARVLPSLNVLTTFCEPAMVWLLVRSAIPPFYELKKAPTPVELHGDLDRSGLHPLYEEHLFFFIDKYFPDSNPGLRDLYFTFWTLDLQDIWCPTEVYEKQISFLAEDLQLITNERRSTANTHQTRRSSDDILIQKELNLMVERRHEWKTVFETELNILRKHQQNVMELLRKKKHLWFQAQHAGSNPLVNFIQYMLAPRLLNSQRDALYCVKFIQMLVDLDTESFYIIDFFNKWTGMLTPLVRSCSIQEADYLGLFFNDMTAIINKWIRDPSFLAQYTKENHQCYNGLIVRENIAPKEINETQTMSTDTEKANDSTERAVLDSSELLKIIGKWENRIFRVIQHGLSLTERETSWMPQRIVIKFLNTTHKNFPITNIAGNQILRSLPALIERAKESRWDDVVANARALYRNLRLMESQWLKRKEDDEEDNKKPICQVPPNSSSSDSQDKHESKKSTTTCANLKQTQNSLIPPVQFLGNSSATSVASHNSNSATNVMHSASLAKGPKNPFHAAFQLASSPRPTSSTNSEMVQGAPVQELCKRSATSSLPAPPRPMPPSLKRNKMNSDQMNTTPEPKNSVQFGTTKTVDSSIQSKSEPMEETYSDSPKEDSIISSDILKNERNHVVSKFHTIPNDSEMIAHRAIGTSVQNQDQHHNQHQTQHQDVFQLTPSFRNSSESSGVCIKDTPQESEEHKFQKQKEIDALRQRMKSLHTYRSKSASSDTSRFVSDDTARHLPPSDVPSEQSINSECISTRDISKHEAQPLDSEVTQRKLEKASGWSDEEDKKLLELQKTVSTPNAQHVWTESHQCVENESKHSGLQATQVETSNQKIAPQTVNDPSSAKRLSTSSSTKDLLDSRSTSLKRHSTSFPIENKEASRDAASHQDGFKHQTSRDTSLKSQNPNDTFLSETPRMSQSNHGDSGCKASSLHSASRRRMTNRLPPPPPPPVNLLMASPPHMENLDSSTCRTLVANTLNNRDCYDGRTGRSSLVRKSLSPPLRDSQIRTQPSDLATRQDTHQKQTHYVSRALMNRNTGDERLGRWYPEDYLPQPVTPTAWNEASHTRNVQGWYHHVSPSGATQWPSYKGTSVHGPLTTRGSSRERHVSHSSGYYYNHRQRSSENGSTFSHQSESPVIKRRQNHRSCSVKKSRSASANESRRHRVQDENNTTTLTYAYSLNHSHPSSLRHKANTLSPLLTDYKTRHTGVETSRLRRSLHPSSSSGNFTSKGTNH